MSGEAAVKEKQIKDMTLSELTGKLRPAIRVMAREALTEEIARRGGLVDIVDAQIQDRLGMMIREGFLATGPAVEQMKASKASNMTEGGLILPHGI